MSWLQNFRKKVNELPDNAEPAAVFAAFADGASDAAQTAAATQADPKVSALESEVARLKAAEEKRLDGDAAAFAKAEVLAGRVLPADADKAKERYLLAAREDAERGPVTFASGPTTRVELLRADFAARPGHGLTDERLNGAQFAVLPNPSGENTAVKQAQEAARQYAERMNGTKA